MLAWQACCGAEGGALPHLLLRAGAAASHAWLPGAAAAPAPRRWQHTAAAEPQIHANGPLLSVEETYIDHRTLTAVDDPRRAAEQAAAGRGPLTAAFLHGLLGSGKNWRSFSKGLAVQAAKRTGRDVRCLLVDLRAHGSSAALGGLHPPHTIDAAGADVVRTLKAALGGAPHVLVGLSLGGKVVLDVLRQLRREQEEHIRRLEQELAAQGQGQGQQQQPQQQQPGEHHALPEPPPPPHRALPLQCWVLDSQPGVVPVEDDTPTSVARILSFVARTRVPIPSRAALHDALRAEGLPKAVAWWLGSGLVPAAPGDPTGPLRWAFDAAGAAALYHSYRMSDYWSELERPPAGVTLHVVRGEHSDRWPPAMLQRLEEAHAAWQAAEVHEGDAVGRLRLHVLPKAGHWLQADNPLGLQAMLLPSFADEPCV